jgi:catechol 2,3-dioxygenase-like lactoylglutathione lyase family enzyme
MSARFNQVAISVADRKASLAFYRDLFGLRHVGGTRFSGKATEAVQGMAGASSTCSWLMDDRPYFQFEIFQFDCPLGRAFASNRQPQDIGYSRLIFSVPALAPVAARAGVEIFELHGQRTAYLRDADGIAVQIIEADVPSARLTGVALSVPDIALAKRSFADGCGCVPLSAPATDWGPLWGEAGADKDMMLLDGGTIMLELSAYRTPKPQPWPDGYKIADHGILNVALGFESAADVRKALASMQAAGIRPNTPLVTGPGLFALTYSQDPQGFSIETLYVSKIAAGAFGFRKANLFDRGLMAIMKAAS